MRTYVLTKAKSAEQRSCIGSNVNESSHDSGIAVAVTILRFAKESAAKRQRLEGCLPYQEGEELAQRYHCAIYRCVWEPALRGHLRDARPTADLRRRST